jgi:hypothetical protein
METKHITRFAPSGNKINIKAREKELVHSYQVIDCSKKTTVIDCRLYMGRSKNAYDMYCNVWFHSCDVWASGTGRAGGSGYDKMSAAISYAFSNMGINNRGVSAVGTEAARALMLEAAVMAGHNHQDLMIVEAYA